MNELEALRDQLIGAEAAVRAARRTVDHIIQHIEAARPVEEETPAKKVPPTFGDSASLTPQES